MQITYMTRVDVESHAAQALQIQSMARAFRLVLGQNFQLVCKGSPPVEYGIAHRSFPLAGSSTFKYLGICFDAGIVVLGRGNRIIFTRDKMVALIVIFLGGRAIYEAHNEPNGIIARLAMKVLARFRGLRLVAISEALRNFYVKNYDFAYHRSLVAHDGVFLEDYLALHKRSKADIKRDLGLPDDKIVIVHTGSLYKGGAELFGEVVKDRDDVIFIHVGGKAAECRTWSQNYTQRNILNIVFIPHIPADQSRKYQVAADLLFYANTERNPVHWCTSPLKLFEYMASLTPILASNVGSVMEVLKPEIALIYDPENPNSIQKQFTRFLLNRSEAKLLAEEALKEVTAKYLWSIRVKNILRML